MAEGTAALWLDYPPTGFIDAGVLFPGGGWITARELFVVGDTEMSQCLGTDNRGYGVLMYVLSLRPSLSTAGILCFLYSFFFVLLSYRGSASCREAEKDARLLWQSEIKYSQERI